MVIGIDGGGLDDLLGLAVLGREKKTRRWLLWSRAWANPSVLDRRKGEVSLLRDFEEAGDLVICKEFGEDIAGIAELAQRIEGRGLLHAVALDPFGVGAIVDALYEIGMAARNEWSVGSRLSHDAAFLRFFRANEIADHGKAGRDADAKLQPVARMRSQLSNLTKSFNPARTARSASCSCACG